LSIYSPNPPLEFERSANWRRIQKIPVAKPVVFRQLAEGREQ